MARLQRGFRWTEDYSVNVAILDRQHQALFATVTQLKEALDAGQGRLAVDAVLNQLVEHAATHFPTEEALMAEHGFPGLKTHRAEHQRFTRRINEFIQSHKAGKTGVPVELMFFMETWLREHLVTADQAWARYFNARGGH